MERKKITKAIVTAGGSGTRFLPFTKSMPKEMLPIIDKPVIQWVVEELVEAGIKDIILVTRWDKKPLEDHFDRMASLERELEKAGKDELLKEITRISEMANFIYVRQKPQYGNGVPVLSAASLVKDEPFVFVWGDDLVKSKESFTKKMIEDYNKTGHMMIGVQEVPLDQVYRYGIVDIEDEKTMKMKGTIEKPTPEKAPSQLAQFGRMILNQEIIDVLRETPLGKGNELWITDAIEAYVKGGGDFYAKKVEDGEWLTTGDPLNWFKANLKYAKERKDLWGKLEEFIKKEL